MNVVYVRELVPRATMRARGAEAYDELVRRLDRLEDRSDVVLDFSGIRPISTSFLDELILRTEGMDLVFQFDSKDLVELFERACSLRGTKRRYKLNGGKTRLTRLLHVYFWPVSEIVGSGDFFESFE